MKLKDFIYLLHEYRRTHGSEIEVVIYDCHSTHVDFCSVEYEHLEVTEDDTGDEILVISNKMEED